MITNVGEIYSTVVKQYNELPFDFWNNVSNLKWTDICKNVEDETKDMGINITKYQIDNEFIVSQKEDGYCISYTVYYELEQEDWPSNEIIGKYNLSYTKSGAGTRFSRTYSIEL